MSRTLTIGLITAALLTVALAAPRRALPQEYDTRWILTTPSSEFFPTSLNHRRAFASCAPTPGFGYGPFMSPFDARVSGYWFSPATRWYGSWAEWPSFGFGSYWPAAGWGAWYPWPASRGGCGYGSAYFWGVGGTSYWGFGGSYGGYSRFGGYSGYGGYGGGYGGYREYGAGRGASTYPDTWSPGGALGLDTGSGHIPESVRRMRGFRVIESRPMTGGADLRRIDPTLSDRSRASEQVSRESMSERVKSVAERTAAPARREVRQPARPAASPRPVPRPLPSTRSATPRPDAGTTRSVAPARTPQERSPSAARSSTKTRPQTRPKS